MPEYDLFYAITLVTVAFCALMFSVLSVFFWRERRSRRRSVFAAFSLACAAAFLLHLLLTIAPGWSIPADVALDLVTVMLPALLLHLVSQGRKSVVRTVFYGVSAVAAIALGFEDVGLIAIPFSELAPTVLLGAASVLGLILLSAPIPRQRAWYRLLLAMTLAATMASAIHRTPVTELAPDYLLLGFFCATLYYQERLMFFDLLIKRGVSYCLVLTALIVFFAVHPTSDPLAAALLLTPLWLLAPLVDARLGRFVDLVFLGRRYSEADAERLFTSKLQVASAEDDLRSRAEGALAAIFQARVEVKFTFYGRTPPEDPHVMADDLNQLGCAVVQPRGSGIPFMSGDRRLFHSLAGTLAVVLENVRFREQQRSQHEREEQLRLLASRAELKALRAQINPHFLFNALNAIAGLIPSQPELADQTIERLAQVFRYTLHKSESEWVRLDEEVEFVAAYLRVEQARFGERLAIDISVNPDAAAIPVPAMCIQPLVENALRHGVSSLEATGKVWLYCRLHGDMLNIEVSDNGPGFPDGFTLAACSGHALRNIDERLRGYYGEMARLSWDSSSKGARVWLQFPSRSGRER